MSIERKGACNDCGWCCQFVVIQRITVPVSEVTPDSTAFYRLRGGLLGEDGKLRVVQHGFVPCSAHDNEKKRCMVYEDRPEVCKAFPTMPDQIEGTPCSHWFELTDEAGEVLERRGGLGSPHATPPRFT